MSSVKSSSSVGDPSNKEPLRHDGRGGEIVKMGYLRKLKTMKKRFFVLRGDSPESSARLEYYEDEKKWRKHHAPRRSISLKTCFNINRRNDTKQKHVIALYTKDDCFGLVLDSEEELEEWLKALLSLQYGEDIIDGEEPKPTFEHVWQVTVLKKGLGSSRNILGRYLLCLTDHSISLVKMSGQEEKLETYEFSLVSIRRCGHSDCFFYMEVGRSSCTGEGELWMQTEDTNIADNMHAAILRAMSNNSAKEELTPRPRSSSTNEVSKPINMLQRRQTHTGASVKVLGDASLPAVGNTFHHHHHVHHHRHHHLVLPVPAPPRPSQRRHSVSAMTRSSTSSVLSSSNAISRGEALLCSHQRTYSFPLSEPAHLPLEARRESTNQRVEQKECNLQSSGRERSDSVPSRTRTISDGSHPVPHQHTSRSLMPGSGPSRPHSVCWPGGSPVSPASGPCSTDSPGSSLSIEEGEVEGWGGYGHSLTPDEPAIVEENCTEEGSWMGSNDAYMCMDPTNLPASLSLPIRKFSPNEAPTSNSFVPTSGFKSGSPSHQDPYSPYGSSPLDSVGGYMTMSPGVGASDHINARRRANSFSNHSRASSLAEETPNGYVPMAPIDDGYVDMDPIPSEHPYNSEEYPHSEMSPASSCSITSGTPSTDMRFSEYHLEKVSSYFTPSEEDETSSLDRPARAYSVGSRPDAMKRANRLEIVNQASDASRVRAFSVGSRTTNKNSSRPLDLHSNRHHSHLATTLTPPHHIPSGSIPGSTASKKSQSAPLLCNSWSGSGSSLRHHLHGGSSHSSMEPMEDLMELDFSRNSPKSASQSTPKSNKCLMPISQRANHDRLSVPLSSSLASTVEGYVDMSIRSKSATGSPPKTSASCYVNPYLETRSTYHAQSKPIPTPAKTIISSSSSASPKPALNVGPYMEMKMSGNSPTSKMTCTTVPQRKASTVEPPHFHGLRISPSNDHFVSASDALPVKASSGADVTNVSPKSSSAYMEMKIGGSGKPSYPIRKPTSPIQEEYLDMTKITGKDTNEIIISSAARTAPVDTPYAKKPQEDYVEMSWAGGSKPLQRSTLEQYRPSSGVHQEDYMNMSFDSSRKKEKNKEIKDKSVHMNSKIAEKLENSINPAAFSLSGFMSAYKNSEAVTSKATPPAFLPLGSSSAGTINSNLSSSKPTDQQPSCSSDMTTPTGSNVTIFPFSLNSPGSPIKPLPGQHQNRSNPEKSHSSSQKYTVNTASGAACIPFLQSFSPDSQNSAATSPESSSSSSEQPTPVNTESITDQHNYANCSSQIPVTGSSKGYRDNFGIASRKISAPARMTMTRPYDLSPDITDLNVSGDAKPEHMLQAAVNAQSLASQPEKESANTPKFVTGCTSAPNKEAVQFTNQTTAISTAKATDDNSKYTDVSDQLNAGSQASNLMTMCNTVPEQDAVQQIPAAVTGSAEATSVPKHAVKCNSVTGAMTRQLSNSSMNSLDGKVLTTENSGVNMSPSSSRPPSVSSERELHYASLDLVPSGSEGEDGSRSPQSLKTQGSLTESSTSSPSPNPANQGSECASFTYAEIDFVKSEGLRNTSVNKKVWN